MTTKTLETRPAVSCSGTNVSKAQYGLFREILSACNGEIDSVYTPRNGGAVSVGYHFDVGEDYREWCERWRLATTPIKESRRDSAWRRMFRRLGIGFVERKIG